MNTKDAAVLEAYLCDGWSHRMIQEQILGIDAPERGGGFEAMKILHAYGITGEYKSSLRGRNFDAEGFEAAGSIQKLLASKAIKEQVGKEVLTSHSHRGFSPVIHTANRVEEPFQR